MNINLIEELDLNKYSGCLQVYNKETIKNNDNIQDLIKKGKLKDNNGSSYYYSLNEKENSYDKVILIIDIKDLELRDALNFISKPLKKLINNKNHELLIDLRGFDNEILTKAAIEASFLSTYKFDKYKSKDGESKEVYIDLLLSITVKVQQIYKEAANISKANIIARNLVNEPANIMTPELLAEKAIKIGKDSGFSVEVLEEDKIVGLGMESFYAVAKGSSMPPKFIIMKYMGDRESKDILGFVGKGLTYDSGGLSIKPTSSMTDMKSDMAGGAAVIGAMAAISKAKIKRNVVAVVAACENMISGESFKPGDIINSMGGKTIYIGNTDAEGRLTLIDAMHYIVNIEKVTEVVDIATLTGAAIHCTGDIASPAISSSDKLYRKLSNSYELAGELIWRMPIFKEYKELLKHEEADLTNMAGSPGTITAGLFIGEFTNGIPWAHIDIAGPSMSKKDTGYYTKGATGCGVKPLYYLAKSN